MDRFEWFDGKLRSNEDIYRQQPGVRLYDGMNKTSFDIGLACVSSHRLIWRDSRDMANSISLELSYILHVEDQASGITKSAKISVHVKARDVSRPLGPVKNSNENFFRLSFTESGMAHFYVTLQEVLDQKRWAQKVLSSPIHTYTSYQKVGIVGIERKIQQKQKAVDKKISKAFEDLSVLMEQAKEMVSLSKQIAQKIKDKQGSISQDETVAFKSYLLSMGIPDPVTRETHGTGAGYFTELAKQLVAILEKPLKEAGGMMTLTDVYCRVNRARGMELLSPEDLFNACQMLSLFKSPIKLREFDSGVIVLQLQSHSEEKIVSETKKLIEDIGSLTATDLAQKIGLSVVLAKERLLITEKFGQSCRDDSIEGLKFYPNLFMSKPPTCFKI